MIRDYTVVSEEDTVFVLFCFSLEVLFTDSAHFTVFPSAPLQVYTYICSDNRMKTISSDKPFVWMTQGDGGSGGGGI